MGRSRGCDQRVAGAETAAKQWTLMTTSALSMGYRCNIVSEE